MYYILIKDTLLSDYYSKRWARLEVGPVSNHEAVLHEPKIYNL